MYYQLLTENDTVQEGDVFVCYGTLERYQSLGVRIGTNNSAVSFRPVSTTPLPEDKIRELIHKLTKANKINKFLKSNMQDVSDFSNNEGVFEGKGSEKSLESKVSVIKESSKNIMKQVKEMEAE